MWTIMLCWEQQTETIRYAEAGVCLLVFSLTFVHFLFLQREIRQQLAEKAKSGDLKAVNGSAASQAAAKRKRRWDQTADQGSTTPSNATPKKMSSWDQADSSAEVRHSSFSFLLLRG